MSWHILAHPGSPPQVPGHSGSSLTILDHPGPSWSCNHPGKYCAQRRWAELHCGFPIQSFWCKCLFWVKCHEMSFFWQNVIFWLFGKIFSWSHIGHQMSQAALACWVRATRIAKEKDTFTRFLCSHILY